MGKRGRSQAEDDFIMRDMTRLRRDLTRDVVAIKQELLPKLDEAVLDIDRVLTLSETNPHVIRDMFSGLPPHNIDKLIENGNEVGVRVSTRFNLFAHILFVAFPFHNNRRKAKDSASWKSNEKCNGILLRLSFSRDTNDIYWMDVIKELSTAAMRCCERIAQQQAQQMIHNVQQQANQAIQQAQQQAMQAQGDMQL